MSQELQTKKRPPQYQIDEKNVQKDAEVKENLELKQKPLQSIQAPQQSNTQRKIFKVKKDSAEQQSQKISSSTNQGIQSSSITSTQVLPKKQTPSNTKSQSKDKIWSFGSSSAQGLFSNLKSTQSSFLLSGNNKNQGKLFGGKNVFQAKGIDTKSIFQGKGFGGRIFNFSQKIPQVKADGGDLQINNNEEGSGDQDQLQATQNIKIDKTKSFGNYKYQDTAKIIISKTAKKYKKNNNDLVEKIEIDIQSDNKDTNHWLVARLSETKNIILIGYILKGVSTLRNMNGKKQNIEIIVFTPKKNAKDPKESFQKNIIRLQFDDAKDAQELYTQLYKLI